MKRATEYQFEVGLVSELCAELERLRTHCGGNCRYWEDRWRDEAKENERLMAAIREALELCDPRETRSFHIGLVLRKALEGK